MTTGDEVPERILIKPGQHYATGNRLVLQTLLGSCVAACLYDDKVKVAGMNHFLLANRRYARSLDVNVTDAGRYGIHAMELLINDMIKLGASRGRLKAKVFGGSTLVQTGKSDNFFCVGEVNIRFIHEFLRTERIPVVSQDLGGTQGRVIRFHTDTHAVFRRFISSRDATTELEHTEYRYWQREVAENPLDKGPVVLFG